MPRGAWCCTEVHAGEVGKGGSKNDVGAALAPLVAARLFRVQQCFTCHKIRTTS